MGTISSPWNPSTWYRGMKKVGRGRCSSSRGPQPVEEQAMGIAGRTRSRHRSARNADLLQRGKYAWNALILVLPRGDRREA